MSSSPYRPRTSVRDAEVYEPGMPVEELLCDYNVVRTPLKMGSNENPYPPPETLLDAYKEVFDRLNRYPDGGSYRLRKALARHYDWPMEGIAIGAGSDELLDCLGKALLEPDHEVLLAESTFVHMPMISRYMGATVREIPLDRSYRIDLRAMAKAVNAQTRLVYLPNPNNPTGRMVPENALIEFFEGLPGRVLVILDEAYFEFLAGVEGPDGRQMLDEPFPPGLVLLRTFSKGYGLAGLRVGYGLMDPQLKKTVDKVRPPFNVTAPAQAVALKSLEHADLFRTDERLRLVEEADRVRRELETRGVETVPSSAHFFLARPPGVDVQEAYKRLLNVGVITRLTVEWGLPGFLRITALRPDQNDEFLARWDEVF